MALWRHTRLPLAANHFSVDVCTGLLWCGRERNGVAHLYDGKPIPHAGLTVSLFDRIAGFPWAAALSCLV